MLPTSSLLFALSDLIRFGFRKDEVMDRRHGMMEKHARTGIAHHRADLLAHIGAVAMRGAVVAERFAFAVATSRNALMRVFFERAALLAKLPFRHCVVVVTVDAYHL